MPLAGGGSGSGRQPAQAGSGGPGGRPGWPGGDWW